MRLFDLVKQHHLIGPPPHCLGQHPALLIADIAGRRADQPGDRVLLHEFRHVDPDHCSRIVEHELRQSLGQFGLADPGWPEEQEGAQGAVRVLQSGPGAADGGGDGLDRVALADDAFAELRLHRQQLLALALQHPVNRNAGPAGHHPGDIVRRDLLPQHRGGGCGLRLGQFALECWNNAVAQLPGPGEITAALRLVNFDPRCIEPLLELGRAVQLLLLALPAGGEGCRLLFKIGEIALERQQPVLRGCITFALQGLALDLQLHDTAVEILDLLGFRFDLHPQPRRCFVHQVDGFVGQEAIGDVAVAERRGGDQCAVGDADTVMEFIFLLQAAQDGDRVFDRGFADEHRLEPAREGGVLLHMLPVLIERRRADTVQLAAGQRRFQQIGRIHRAFGFAGTDQGVHLVNEQQYVASACGDFVEHAFQPFLELAAIFGSGNQAAHVERHQLLALQAVRHVAVDDAEGQPFGNRGLADAGFTNQDRVILGAAGQYLNSAADFLIPADDRIKLAVARRLGQVTGKFLERVIAVLGPCGIGAAALADPFDGGVQALRCSASFRQRIACRGALCQRQCHQQSFHGDKAVPGLGGQLLGLIQHSGRVIVPLQLLRTRPANLGDFGQGDVGQLIHRPGVTTRRADQACRHALIILDQGFQQMLRCHALVAVADRDGLGGLQEALGALGEFLDVHSYLLIWSDRYGVAELQHKGCARDMGSRWLSVQWRAWYRVRKSRRQERLPCKSATVQPVCGCWQSG